MIRPLKNLFLEFVKMGKELKTINQPKKSKKTTPFIQIEFKIPEPTNEEIQLLAYHKWEQSQENKTSEQYWKEAEEELKGKFQENIKKKECI